MIAIFAAAKRTAMSRPRMKTWTRAAGWVAPCVNAVAVLELARVVTTAKPTAPPIW